MACVVYNTTTDGYIEGGDVTLTVGDAKDKGVVVRKGAVDVTRITNVGIGVI